MADEKKDSGTAAALDAAAVKALITDALAPLIANQKVIADTMAADAKAKADAAAADKAKAEEGAKGKDAKPLAAEDVSKIVQESLASALKSQAEQQQSTAARNAFIGEKLKGLPAPYQAKLGSDPAKWAAEEQQIRDAFKADLAAVGATVKDVGGGNPAGKADGGAAGGVSAAAAMNLSPGQAAFAQGLVLPA